MKKHLSISLCVIVLLVHTFLNDAISAEVTLEKDDWGDPIVDISGKIEKGDLVKIKEKSKKLISAFGEYSSGTLQFHLNTGGGDVEEAMKIGRFAREILAKIDSYGKIIIAPGSEEEKTFFKPEEPWKHRDYVVLAPEAEIKEKDIVRNYSSGILIFYGAVKRAHRDNADRRLGFYKQKNIPVIGLHRPYYEKEYFSTLSPSEASKAYKHVEKTVRNYLTEMGAPQSIIDRMFNRASNDIDLLTDDEFRKYYKSEESFLEEWLIAKCGATGVYRNTLTDVELRDFEKINREQVVSRSADKTPMGERDIYKIYPSNNFSMSYIEQLYIKVRKHNRTVNNCRTKAVSSHQREWAQKYKGM